MAVQATIDIGTPTTPNLQVVTIIFSNVEGYLIHMVYLLGGVLYKISKPVDLTNPNGITTLGTTATYIP